MASDALPPAPTWIGRPMPRAATRRLVVGRGHYTDDHAARGERHAAFLRSPHPHATFTITSTAAARALPGVAAVLTAADLAPVCQPWQCASRAFPGLVSPIQHALAEGRAAYQGEPVALVLAASRAIAEDAVELIEVTWTDLPAVTDLATALDPTAPRAHPDLASNLAWSTELTGGDPDAAFAAAALIVETRLDFARQTGVTLEARAILATPDPAAGALEVRVSHQMPHQLQLHLAELLGLSQARVRVIAGDVGGGFGTKMHVYPDEVAACAAAMLTGRPVRYVADRMESLMADTHAREHQVAGRMAVSATGHILGFDVTDLQGLGAYSVFPRSSTTEAMSALKAVGAPYRFTGYRARLRCALQNKVPTGQFRAVGHPIGCALTERLVELAAAARGEDGTTFRRRNLLRTADQPYRSPSGGHMFSLSHHACLDRLEAVADFPALRARVASLRAAGRLAGLGLASVVEFTAPTPEAYGRAGVPVAAVDTVTLTLEISGEITAKASVAEIGQGITQTVAQAIAEAFGTAPDRVQVTTGDTGSVPHGGGAWASRGAAIGGEAAWAAARKLREQVLIGAAALLQSTPDALDIRAGRVVDAASGTDRLAVADLARTVVLQGYELPAGVHPQLSVAHTYRREDDPYLPNNGTHACLVELDPGTGLVTVLGYWVVADCGRVLNPLLVAEQVRGGVVLGLGEALLEACRYAPDGALLTGTLADYLVPMAAEAPDIVVEHVETPYLGSVLGAKGAGEAGTCGAPAAVLNAVNDALAPHGAHVDALPITPPAILRALGRLP